MKTIATLNLLESGNVEMDSVALVYEVKSLLPELNRMAVLESHWNNPELQALLDKFIIADKGGM